MSTSAAEGIERLREGNRRYVEEVAHGHVVTDWLREQLVEGQQPFAIVLGCSDSRVPVEIVFDQRPGELFVIRIAGNVATAEAIGSAEFAATALGTRLIVVLGHSGCGAVGAALDSLDPEFPRLPPHLGSIVDAIVPAAESAMEALASGSAAPGGALEAEGRDALLAEAVRRNVDENVARFRASHVLAELIDDGALQIVGAEYDLESGRVDFHRLLPPG